MNEINSECIAIAKTQSHEHVSAQLDLNGLLVRDTRTLETASHLNLCYALGPLSNVKGAYSLNTGWLGTRSLEVQLQRVKWSVLHECQQAASLEHSSDSTSKSAFEM